MTTPTATSITPRTTQWERDAKKKRRFRYIFWPLLLIGLAAGIYLLATSLIGESGSVPQVATTTAKTMTIRDLIVNTGRLESQKTVKALCEIEGYVNKIIFIAPEGTIVKKDDVVVKFDEGQALKDIEEQEQEVIESKQERDDALENVTVQENENQSSIREAQQALDFAKVDLEKYLEGDYEVSKSDMEFAISEAQTEVDKAKRAMENMRALVKRGFRQFEQLREAEQVVTSSEIRLKTSKQKLDILIKFDHPKQKKELESKAKEASFKLDSAKATAKAKATKAKDYLKYRTRRLKREEKQLEGYKKNLKKFVMKAPQDGTVMYPATEDYFGPGNGIREGGTVYQNQTVYILPNLRKMQVKVSIHESEVSKIKLDQKATIRIEAFPQYPLKGTVKKIGNVAETSWMGTTSEYSVLVHIDNMPQDMALKPGMKAQVEISAGHYPNVLGVPIQAVASFAGRRYVYISKGNDEFERKEVQVGKSNVSFVEVTDGLNNGDIVALDAFNRSIEDFGDVTPEELADAEEPDSSDEETASEQPKPQEAQDEPEKGDKKDDSEIGKTSSEAEMTDEELETSENEDAPKTGGEAEAESADEKPKGEDSDLESNDEESTDDEAIEKEEVTEGEAKVQLNAPESKPETKQAEPESSPDSNEETEGSSN